MGNEVTVIASLFSFDKNGKGFYIDHEQEYISKDEFKVIRINYKKPFLWINRKLRRYKGLYNLLLQEKPEIIFIHGCQFLDIIKIKKYFRKNKDIRIYIDNHADYINSGTNIISRILLHRILWRYCARVIEPFVKKFYGVTPLRCDYLKNVYKINTAKIELLELGIDDRDFNLLKKDEIRDKIRHEHNLNSNDFIIITGGKIDERKKVHILLRSFIELTNENVYLIIFGSISNDMRAIIDRLSNSIKVIKVGWINSNRIHEYFAASDLAFFPGTHSVLWEESVGCGLPGVYKFWEGMDHLNLGGNCRFLYTCNEHEILKILKEVTNNPDYYKQMKLIAESEGKRKFYYSTIADKALQ
jgi:glycosyltransferase involved in cell wall biosynthesis